MAKLIFHKNSDREEVELRRLRETARKSPMERWKLAFELIALSAMFRKDKSEFFKKPEGKGIVLRQKA